MAKNRMLSLKPSVIICAVLMGLISIIAFCSTNILSKSTGSVFRFLYLFNERFRNTQILLIVAWIGISMIYLFWLTQVNNRFVWQIVILAFFFSVCTTLYASMDNNMVLHPGFTCVFLHLLGYFMFYYVIVSSGFLYTKSSVKISRKEESLDNKKLFLIIYTVLFLLWLPWIIMCFPGNIMWDTGQAFEFILGKGWNNNPFFQNYLHGGVYKFGELIGNIDISIFLYDILQLLLFIAVIDYAIVLLRKKNVPFLFLVCLVLFYGLFPIFPLYAFCMGKDSNFGLCVLIFSLLIFELLSNKKEDFNRSKVVMLFFSSLLLGLLRNQAYLIVVLILFCCSLVKGCEKYRKLLMIICVSVLITNFLLPRLFQIPKIDISENLSIPLQQTAYYVNRYDDEVTTEEKEAINKVIPYESFKMYNPGMSDPVKDKFDDSASAEDIYGYLQVWCKHFFKHPTAYLKAFFYGSYAYYCPSAERRDLKPHSFLGYAVDNSIFFSTELKPNINPGISIVRTLDNYVTDLPVLGLFQKIGIYVWIILCMVIFIFLHRQYKWLLCVCPIFLIFIGICCSPVNGYVRYAFPMIVCVPIICLGIIFILKENVH